ncbi:MAG: hypothetical protein O2816_08315 [Planctomycetota bacterium]|nr:hypothetical protein [Planctomycetota bacterium]
MSKKTDLVAKLIQAVDLRHPVPENPAEGLDLISHGAVLVLMRHLTERQAVQSVESLRGAYVDWNEVRVCQLQEISSHLKTGSRKKGPALLKDLGPAAMALKAYLQNVFQETHGMDLEILREDPTAAGLIIAELDSIGMTGGGYLLWLAAEGRVPVHTAVIRILDRLGLIARTTSIKKAQAMIDPLVPKGEELAFTLCFHEIADRWTDPDDPIYMTVDLLQTIPAGRKARKDRLSQLEREAVRRERDEERQRKADEREAERLRKEEEKESKRLEAELRKRQKDAERKAEAIAREKDRIKKKKAFEVAKKKAAAKKDADKKKAASKNTSAKKPAAKKKAAKTSSKKAAAKKPTARKAAKKAPAKKKTAAKKATAKKATAKKATAKQAAKAPAKKRTAAKKPAAKKTASKKKPAAKKASKTATRRR